MSYKHLQVQTNQTNTNRQRTIATLGAQLGPNFKEWNDHPRYEEVLQSCHSNIYGMPGAFESGLDVMVQSGVRIFNNTTKDYTDKNSVDLALCFYDSGVVDHETLVEAIARKA